MSMKLKPVMFVGTCSDAGKSIINTAFCRIFRQDGYSPAPFKAQNMSLNSYSTPEGGEIGRAQAVQAEACGLPPHTDMNPLLLKPTHNQSSQVVLNGKPVGNMTAKEYFTNSKTALLQEALNAFRGLASRHNPIVLEGAGSISELNLRDKDITNMRMAREVQAATYLVADIDRGGVFASVYGSVALLPPEEKALLKGIIINKFRGDISLFEEGRKMLENLTGIPVVGVVPYFDDIHIEAEDSVALNKKNTQAVPGKINVAVVLLKCLSNFTDFDVLERDERFHLYYT
ncbi:MAG: cobyric acid synthase, partial [Odoribacter sp.]|nr:cobyric acid synthase [Odoribacter sp.]